ncbi:restriction endonuclease [Acinetobacter pollinis]|uniref:restriction endonuclease n=1 Tax=Acinetobacter pollinis TaxID=2605270 RepID=UPI001B3C8C63|nr:restriction endonuclease [Acinetobacter pollinis]
MSYFDIYRDIRSLIGCKMFVFNPTVEGMFIYRQYLAAIAQLSNLFSDNAAPYLDYRSAENIFCKAFDADNLSRTDTAFDAKIDHLGIGIKTFICKGTSKKEKVAEFNAISSDLKILSGLELAIKVSEYRNQRIDSAYSTYALKDSVYHLITRRDGRLLIFETLYERVDIKNITVTKDTTKTVEFNDGKNFYSFNFSKSTLFKQFDFPTDNKKILDIPIAILEDPYSFILGKGDVYTAVKPINHAVKELEPAKDYIVIPLYIPKDEKSVPLASGLNLWNAAGRPRDSGEMELRLNKKLRDTYTDNQFFPPKDQTFNLKVPDGSVMRAKVCQQDCKALMTNPNKDISTWLLRTVLLLKERELLTYEHLEKLGIDSVIVTKVNEENYTIDKALLGSYEAYLESCMTR